MSFLRHFHYLCFIAVFGFVAGCEELGYQPEAEVIQFGGIKSVISSKNGSYIISWDAPKNDSIAVASFEIYMIDLNQAPDSDTDTTQNPAIEQAATSEGEAGVDGEAGNSQVQGQGQGQGQENDPSKLGLTSGNGQGSIDSSTSAADQQSGVIVGLPPQDIKGNVLGAVSDQTTFTIPSLLPGNYGFHVKALDKEGKPDGNNKVLLITIGAPVSFIGLLTAEAVGNQIHLTWPEFRSGIKNGEPIIYILYEGDEKNNFVFNNPVRIIDDAAQTTLSISSEDKNVGSIWNYGIRVQNPLGDLDKNTRILPVTIPNRDLNYQGCVDGLVLGSSKIQIDFTFLKEAEKVNIYRNSILAYTSNSSTQTRFIDVGLLEGEEYEYKCESIKSGVSFMGANILLKTTLSTNPPNFNGVQNVTVSSPNSIVVGWGVATGVPAQYFAIYVTPGTNVDWGAEPIKSVQPTELSATIDELGDDMQYAVGVRACSINDVCDTNVTSIIVNTPDGGAPLTPGAASARMEDGNMIITASWEHKNGGIVKRYAYLYDGPGLGDNFANYTTPPVAFLVSDAYNPITELEVTSLNENTTYKIIVRDEDVHGNRSQNVSFVTIDTGDLSAPSFTGITQLNLGLVGQRETSIIAGFTAIPSEAMDNAGASHYQIYLRVGGFEGGNTACNDGAFYEEFSALPFEDKSAYEYTIDGLTPRTKYDVCIKARDSAGNISSTDGHLPKSTIDETAPNFDGIQPALVYDIETGLMTVNWLASNSSDIMEYQVKVWKNTPSPVGSQILTMTRAHSSFPDGFTFDNSSFDFGSNDQVYVVVNACDTGGFIPGGQQNCTEYPLTSALNVTLADIDPPPGFAGISAETELTTPAEDTVIISWIAPADWSDYLGFKIYTVDEMGELEFVKLCECSTLGCPEMLTICPVGGLDPFRTYTFHVRAYDDVGNLTILDIPGKSTPKQTADFTAPVYSSNLSLDFADGMSNLEWSLATDNQYADEPGAVITYSVYRKSTSNFGNALTPEVDGDLLVELTDSGIYADNKDYASGETYFYTTCASDATGNRTCDGNVKSIITPDLIPPVIGEFTATKQPADKTWSLNWTMSDNIPGPLLVKVRRSLTEEIDGPVDESHSTVTSAYNILEATGMTGPINTDTHINYLLTVEDSAGNKAEARLSLFSQNYIEVMSVKSNEGPTSGGKLVLIEGIGFHSSTTVKIGASTCSNVQYISNDKIICRTPLAAEGLESIYVENSDLSSWTLNDAYSYCSGVSCINICNRSAEWGTEFADGTGIAANPYIICDDIHLNNTRNFGHGKFLKFGDNVDLSAYTANDFLPLSTSGVHFYAHVEGDGYVVANYKYHAPPLEDYVGLFRTLYQGYDITNLGVVNVDIKGNSYVGGMIGTYYWSCSTCKLENVFTTGVVEATGSYVGGIAGRAGVKIINAYSSTDVTGMSYVGGITGYKYYISALLHTTGNIQGTAGGSSHCYVGGLVGYWNAPVQVLDGAYATGDVTCTDTTGTARYTGGLFGSIGSNATLTNCSYDGNVYGRSHVGGIVGSGSASMSNCKSSGTVTGNSYYVGGIAGAWGTSTIPTITETYSTSEINGTAYAGGFMGYVNGGEINDSYATGNVTTTGSMAGGFVGYAEYSYQTDITNSYATGSVTGSTMVGGFVGRVRGTTKFADSYATGDAVATTDHAGGFIGYVDYLGVDVVNSHAAGSVSGNNYIGGFVGHLEVQVDKTVSGSYATGTASGNAYVGGFVGYLNSNGNTGAPDIADSFATGDVIAIGNQVGGFVGRQNSNTDIVRSYAEGDVKGMDYVGGFIGYAYYYNYQIYESYAKGDVEGESWVGGFFGRNYYGREFNEVADCYAHGDVVGTDYIGGFAGGTSDRIQRIYAKGNVSQKTPGVGYIGGITAHFRTTSYPGGFLEIPDSYWDSDTTNQTTSASNQGEGKTTEQMKLDITYNGWDFGSVWTMPTNGYPKFTWEE